MAKQHSTTTESKQDKTITEAISLLYAQLKQPKTESLNNPSKVKFIYLLNQFVNDLYQLTYTKFSVK